MKRISTTTLMACLLLQALMFLFWSFYFLSLWHTCRTSKISTKTFSLAHFGARKLIAWSHTFLSAIDPQAAAISRRRQPLSSLAIASHYRRQPRLASHAFLQPQPPNAMCRRRLIMPNQRFSLLQPRSEFSASCAAVNILKVLYSKCLGLPSVHSILELQYEV